MAALSSARSLGVALGLILLGACSVPAGTGPGAPVSPAAAPVELAALQELTVAVGADQYRTDAKRNLPGQYPLNANIYDTLVTLSPTYQIEPGLATRWEFRAPNTYRFTLRPNVKFHDGTPFTAKDVKATMDRMAGAGGGTIGIDERSTTIVDDLTVEITPKRTNLRALEQLVHPAWSIHKAGSDVLNKPTGTGPFKFVGYTKGERFVVEANDEYWGGRPTLRKITFRFIPDPNTRVLALQAGEIQITDVPRESAKTFATSDLRLHTSKVGAYEALYVNVRGADQRYDLGRDRAVREALAYAIDKQAAVQNVWQGNAEVIQTMIPPAILGGAAGDVKGTLRDTGKAKKILDDAGWKPAADGIREKGGRKLSLTLVNGFPSADAHKPLPELMQAQLKDVGIELKIVTVPDSAAYEKLLASGAQGDLWLEAGSQNDGNPCFLPDLLFSSPVPGGDDAQNMYGNAFALGESFDRSIKKCREATAVEDVQKAAAESMRILVDQEFVVVPIAGTYRLWGATAKLVDFVAHPSGLQQRWDKVKLAR